MIQIVTENGPNVGQRRGMPEARASLTVIASIQTEERKKEGEGIRPADSSECVS